MKLNKRRINALARFLEKLPPEKFDMGTFGQEHACGTVACLAGWEVCRVEPKLMKRFIRAAKKLEATPWSFGGDNGLRDRAMSAWERAMHKIKNTAAKSLGLDTYTANRLFLDEQHASHEDAIQALRYLAKHGEVVWYEEP